MDFHDQNEEVCIAAVESVLDRLDDAIVGGFDCLYSEDLFYRPIYNGLTVWELFSAQSPIANSPEVRIRLGAAFSKMSAIQDKDLVNQEIPTARFANTGVECSYSLAWACHFIVAGVDDVIACISSPIGTGDASFDIVSDEGTAKVWFVSSQRGDEQLFRWFISEHTYSSAEMESYASSAFRELDFVKGAFSGIKDMSKPYVNLVTPIVRHLSALSDEGRRIFSGPRKDVEAEFGPYGVDLSDENGATRRNARARTARTVTWDKQERICWWHTKLERNQDRIHFCPADLANGGNILVGIFAYHLT